jgi:N,N-dimethylformamidase
MAYANQNLLARDRYYEVAMGSLPIVLDQDVFLSRHPEYGKSLYDRHVDGSGVCYSSRLRPMLNCTVNSRLWTFAADGYLTAWLDWAGFKVDVYTDEDLHKEGFGLLEPYRVLITGSHPEYVSTEMFNAVEDFLKCGGRLMYLGGNGFYWRAAFHSDLDGVIEVRRAEDGSRTWASEPGEYYLSFTGEYGGMWRRQGRAPNLLFGVGFCAQGFDIGSHYVRRPGSFDARARFIFEGIGEDELIGNFGIAGGGAAGQELDRFDLQLGSPRHALILASSENHSDGMLLTKEEFDATHPLLGGSENPLVRADMVFFETPGGGAVFSTGSISWSTSLPWNGGANNVSRITRNVLERFLDPTPFKYPETHLRPRGPTYLNAK